MTSTVIRSLDDRKGEPILDPEFPSVFSSWQNSHLVCETNGTHFGFVHTGPVSIHCRFGDFQLSAGMYFSVPSELEINGGSGFIATRVDYEGTFQIGGPIEQQGRLRYIDGCSDSLLISPVVFGDPCLNFLYIPPNTNQTQHTHPSCRVGMIAEGCGWCQTPDERIPLSSGQTFLIPPGGLHSFHTSNEPLRVIAWHPDSDCGPQHRDHPMINRTIIKGESAAKIKGSQDLLNANEYRNNPQ